MEFTVSREILIPALSRVTGIVARRQTLPILSHLLIETDGEQLNLVASDLEIEIRTSIPATVKTQGAVTLPARKLTDICRNLPDDSEIRCKVERGRATMISGRGRFVLGTLPAEDFPRMQREDTAHTIRLAEGQLRRMFDKTAFAMAQQDVRYYLNGLFIEFADGHLTTVATDGHRLSRFRCAMQIEMSSAHGIILPAKTVQELKRQLSASENEALIELGEKTFYIRFGDVEMRSKLVDGRYPDYERVIPSDSKALAELDRDTLRQVLTRTAVLSNEKYRGVQLGFQENTLKLTAQNPEQEEAEDEMELDYQGEPASIGFNVGYLQDVLNAIDVATVEVRFSDSGSSSLWRGKGIEEETFVVMPMRL